MENPEIAENAEKSSKLILNLEQKTQIVVYLKPDAKYLYGNFVGFDGRMKRVAAFNSIFKFSKG